MKIDNNTDIQGMKAIEFLPTLENEQRFTDVVGMIRQTRQNVIRIANTALFELYWKVGGYLSQKIADAEWGDGVVRQLADYICNKFPDIKGFSDKNLWRMKQFYETYVENAEKLSALLRQISWTNHLTIKSRCKTSVERAFYLRSFSPTMVAEYQLCLPNKTLLQQKMKKIEDEMDQLDSNT